MHKDALGNQIEAGKIYGYSNRVSGIVSIIIGKVIDLSKSKVTLEVIHRGTAAYDYNVHKETLYEKKNVSVIANSLFPLASSEVFWEETNE